MTFFKKKNIITCDEIKKILIKYNVSQKTLSKLLGWGEITLTRYITKNYTPNKENNDLLKEIENPYIFLKYINKELQNENSSIDKKLIIKSQREVNSLLTKMENENGTRVVGNGKLLGVLENNILKQYNVNAKMESELNVEINNPISDYKDRYLVIGQKGGNKAYLIKDSKIRKKGTCSKE